MDGTSYEYLGTGSQTLPSLPNLQEAIPQSVSYDSQYSNFTFLAGPVEVTASFLSAVIPKDICRTSIPLSYLTTTVRSIDGNSHNVQFYSDINAAWIAYESNKTIEWALYEGSNPINGSQNATGGQSSVYTWYSPKFPQLLGSLTVSGCTIYRCHTSSAKSTTSHCGAILAIHRAHSRLATSASRAVSLQLYGTTSSCSIT